MSGGPIARRPWLWVIAAFIALIVMWTILITLANRYKPKEVPLPGKAAAEGDAHGR